MHKIVLITTLIWHRPCCYHPRLEHPFLSSYSWKAASSVPRAARNSWRPQQTSPLQARRSPRLCPGRGPALAGMGGASHSLQSPGGTEVGVRLPFPTNVHAGMISTYGRLPCTIKNTPLPRSAGEELLHSANCESTSAWPQHGQSWNAETPRRSA